MCKCANSAQLSLHFGHFAPFACLTLQTLLRQMVSDGLLATPLWSIALARGYTCLTFPHCALSNVATKQHHGTTADYSALVHCAVLHKPAQMLGLARGRSRTKHETGKSSHQVAPPSVPSSKYRIREIMHTCVYILERNQHIWNMVVMAETIWALILVKCEGLKKGQSASSKDML